MPLLCELNLLGRPCGAVWVNKELWQHVFLKRACRCPQRLPPTGLCLCLPVRPTQAVPELCPKTPWPRACPLILLKVILLVAELLTHIILIFKVLFFCRVEQQSVFTTILVLTLPQHYALALDIARYNYLCQMFLSFFVNFDACQYTRR